jgi:16S rRNA (guanine966-N2)-methyltransferase|tara:strand:- start:6879 stop:7439 length:561 start_codon:yes stop_codon:yes gene_type:complete
MRIISGVLKGKSINFLKNSTTRPLKDAVKENIFNILRHSNLINGVIENANILDLYSGIGSFGLECISRGAKKVTFVEHDRNAANILNENLVKLNIKSKATIINNKVEKILGNNKIKKFDIFFFDPPFTNKEFVQTLNSIKNSKIYKIKHVVIIHREKKTQDKLNSFIDIILSKQYGRSKIIFGVFN